MDTLRHTHIVKCWQTGEILGYYFSYADAVKAVNTFNTVCYVLELEII